VWFCLQTNSQLTYILSDQVWGYGSSFSKDSRCPWLQGRVDTMILHLKNCGRQPDELRQQAEQLAVECKWIQGTSTSVASSSVVYHPQPIAPSPFHPMMTHISIPPPPQASQGALVPFPGSSIQVSPPGTLAAPSLMPVIDPMLMHPGSGLTYSPSLSSGALSPVPSSMWLPSAPSSHPGTPVLETLSLPLLKHRRLSTQRLASGTPPASPIIPQWSNAHQEHFERHMANITASCGFPFSWVENQAVRNFLDDLLPLAAHISSYQLTNRIVPQEVDQYRQLAKSTSKGCQATLQTDGWTGINFHHLVAFMVTTVKRKVSRL